MSPSDLLARPIIVIFNDLFFIIGLNNLSSAFYAPSLSVGRGASHPGSPLSPQLIK